MADFGVFVGFGFPTRGREEGATKVFQELIELLARAMQGGRLESFEPAFLQPHGGDLGGFVLIRGERVKLDEMVSSDDFVRLMTRAQTIVENFGVVNCWLGNQIQQQMSTFLPDTQDLR